MPGPFEEGPVEISFEPSKGKQKMTIVIDFGETGINAYSAGKLTSDIIQLLRERLGVELSMFKD